MNPILRRHGWLIAFAGAISGYIAVGNTPDVFGRYVKSEIECLGKLIRAFKLAVDG